jgi:Ca2+-binding RTX toxin-like protein
MPVATSSYAHPGESVSQSSTALTVTAIITGVLLGAPGKAATAMAEACQGRAASIVGTGPPVMGTPGDDVIVSGTSTELSAYGGNDLICITATSTYVGPTGFQLDAGTGDDVIDASMRGDAIVRAQLGEGRDSYLGGSATDLVSADGVDDDVSTGLGHDFVDLNVTRAVAGPLGRYDGGPGPEAETFIVRGARFGIELELDEHIAIEGMTGATVSGFQHATVYAGRVVLRGNPENNQFSVWGCELRVDGEGGHDRLSANYAGGYSSSVADCGAGDRRTRLSGGTGRDTLTGWGGPDRLVGGAGHDQLRGSNGVDRLLGGWGRDVIQGGGARDTADGSSGRDRCNAEVELRCER